MRIFAKILMVVFLSAMFVAPSWHAYARKTAECGDVSKGLVKDVYVAGRRVDYLVDVKMAMDSFCASAQNLETWEKRLSRKQRTSEYKRARKAAIKSAERDLRSLRGYLVTIRGLALYDSHDNLDEALRRSKTKKAVKGALSKIMALGQHTAQFQMLMFQYGN